MKVKVEFILRTFHFLATFDIPGGLLPAFCLRSRSSLPSSYRLALFLVCDAFGQLNTITMFIPTLRVARLRLQKLASLTRINILASKAVNR